jgi:N-hydroxyarylamine O-acetyltransferase
VDVGCGRRTPLGPIPFGPGDEVDVAGWGHRVVRDGPELVLRARGPGGAWEDLYGFVPEPAPVVDLETSSWFTSTYPRSPFVTGLIVARPDPDGTRVSLSDWEDGLVLAVETPGGRDVTPVAPEDVPALLAERFGLPAFSHR